MKFILLLCTLLALTKTIHGFCIYNQLTEETYILVQQERDDLSVGKYVIAIVCNVIEIRLKKRVVLFVGCLQEE
jgi:hypothetical protein